MSVSLDEVRHIAALARLGVGDDRVRALAVELSSILDHMQVLSRIDASDGSEAAAQAEQGMTLRPDTGPPIPLARPPVAIAPEMRDGFLLVPRLETHEEPERSA